MNQQSPLNAAQSRRQRWLSVLAKAPAQRVEALWNEVRGVPPYSVLRRPEIGLVMLKGRISGSGDPFALGEMTVTRAAVRMTTGEVGFGYAGGRHPRQAEIIAVMDALGQRGDWQQDLEEKIVAPLEREALARHRELNSRAAATRVDFFTVAREAGT